MANESPSEFTKFPYETIDETMAYLYGAQLGMAWGIIVRNSFELADAKQENERLLREGFREVQESARHQRKLMRAELEAELAFIDHQTGILNYRGLEEAYGKVTADTKDGEEGSILYLDLDHFKNINDRLGHGGADRLLGEVAATMKGCLRESDIIGRHGGDEFMIMLNGTGKEAAIKVATNVRNSLRMITSFRDADGQPVIPTATIGIDEINPALGFQESFQKADRLMLDAKESGVRNEVFWVEDQPSVPTDRI